MSPAGRGARLPGEAPQAFCERCGRSVEVATIGQRVGLCHCPACDIFACRSCWSEAAEACPECGVSFAESSVTEVLSELLAAGALTANALRSEALATEEPLVRPEERAAWAAEPGTGIEVPAAWAVAPAPVPSTTFANQPTATGRWKARGVPIGIGIALVVVAAFALILGDPFRAGGVASETNSTSSSTVGASAEASAASPGAEESPTSAATTDPPETGPIAQPTSGPATTPRPTAAATARPAVTATPRPAATPTPTPRATAAPTADPSPQPSPTPTPTPEPTPACLTVPDLVGLTIRNARSTWIDAGFTGGFSPANGQNNRIVATQNRPSGACLPPSTSIAVTT